MKNDVVPYILQCASKGEVSTSSILQLSEGGGRKQRLTKEEEKIIVNSVLYFQNNTNTLDRISLLDLVQTLLQTFKITRKKNIAFESRRNGRDWLKAFLKRNNILSVKRRIGMGQYRCSSMNLENFAKNFFRLNKLMKKLDIVEPSRIFNLEKSGFPARE